VHTAAWSPNGARIASASNDTTVQGWDARTGTPIFTCNHTSTVNAVAWSPDGKRIASASASLEKTVQVCWLLRASVQNAKSWQDDFSLFYKP
jgi:eukaryotic-like serine/threonine-protein kinase